MKTAVFYAVRIHNGHPGENSEPCVSEASYKLIKDLLELSQGDANRLASDLKRHAVRNKELYEENYRLRDKLEKYEPPLAERIRRIHQK